jgi:sulfur transfer protein SufE
MMRNKEMTMWFETMTYEEKRYRYLLRTGGTVAAIADALEKYNTVREKEIDD